jgi:hypothetical protein
MKSLFVGGSFDEQNGKFSNLADKIHSSLGFETQYYNGGNYQDLLKLAEDVGKYETVFWLARIPEDKPRISATLKENGNFIFVSSKRNMDEKLTTFDMIYDALKIKSNLMLEFKRNEMVYLARVLDPLGNVFLDFNSNFELVGKVLGKRTKELASYTRVRTESIGEKIDPLVDEEFLGLIKHYAGSFSDFVYNNPEAINRHMGNASFRCASGFPSFRKDGLVYVSRRNVDKRGVDSDSFVAVDVNAPKLSYYGVKKPSVDTPIQVKLYQNYSNLNFMLHSHNYVRNAKFTDRIIPCGAVEEADEIMSLFPDKDVKAFSVNLKGHGSLVASSNLDYFKNLDYFARPIPEFHSDYLEDLK